jgi:hypothetical protein
MEGPGRMGLRCPAPEMWAERQQRESCFIASTEEDGLKPAAMQRKLILIAVVAFLASLQIPAFAQEGAPKSAAKPTPPAKSSSAKTKGVSSPLPKVWHSVSSHHDFRVEVTNEAFHAEWVNLPPAAAKQGAYIRTECNRTGPKWVGFSNINMLFAVPGAPAGKDTKLCHFKVRFEVDSISPEKITGHSEALRDFDVNTCQVRKASWGEFTWVPKK